MNLKILAEGDSQPLLKSSIPRNDSGMPQQMARFS